MPSHRVSALPLINTHASAHLAYTHAARNKHAYIQTTAPGGGSGDEEYAKIEHKNKTARGGGSNCQEHQPQSTHELLCRS